MKNEFLSALFFSNKISISIEAFREYCVFTWITDRLFLRMLILSFNQSLLLLFLYLLIEETTISRWVFFLFSIRMREREKKFFLTMRITFRNTLSKCYQNRINWIWPYFDILSSADFAVCNRINLKSKFHHHIMFIALSKPFLDENCCGLHLWAHVCRNDSSNPVIATNTLTASEKLRQWNRNNRIYIKFDCIYCIIL